ncbi:hypothetical protein ACTJKC_22570 [Pedobacter sp. 22226]|uniref:hypothetical protein n=1 Tax=Pedobacter sp. 22226 TaxID=3453894 RepID=UPI003F8762D6
MFDNSFPFTKHFTDKFQGAQYLKERTTYIFKTQKEKYHLEVEEYLFNIYVLKFFPARLKKHPEGSTFSLVKIRWVKLWQPVFN